MDEFASGKHVLVVEDEPDFAALLRSMLVRAGYTVATAYDCEDALAQVREHRPDLITLDMKMPGRSGIFFYRKLKADKAFRDVPVVVVTGLTRDDRDMENLIHSFLETEKVPYPQAYVEKPVDATGFLKTVGEAISSAVPASP
jgi:CheY-like chemotaxis protein